MELIDLTVDAQVQVEKVSKKLIKRVRFEPEVLGKVFCDFAGARPREGIAWCTGVVDEGIAMVKKYWGCELEYSSFAGARTKNEWLLKTVEGIVNDYPHHNLILIAHSHPIGSKLSQIDENSLLALTEWNSKMYFVMVAFDFEMGCYYCNENKIDCIEWGVYGCEEKPLRIKISSTTSSFSLVKRIFRRLRRLA